MHRYKNDLLNHEYTYFITVYGSMLPTYPGLGVLLNAIIGKYFATVNCIYLISENVFLDVNTNKSTLVYNFRNESLDLSEGLYMFGCHGFIIHANNPREMFEQVELTIRFTPGTKFHERRYILLPLVEGDEFFDDLFESESMEYVADVVLAQSGPNGTFNLWTHKFAGADNHREPIFLDTWYLNNHSFMNEVNLYPDKLTDQYGRVLRISTFDYKPYINIDSRHGIELMMAKEYAKHQNLSTAIIIETEFWGVFNEVNYTATGAKGTLLSDKADISLGSWYRLPLYTQYFDLTESTVRIGVTFLVPAPELAAGWFTPLFSFSTPLWLGFIFSYFALTLSLFGYEVLYEMIYQVGIMTVPKALAKSIVIMTVTLFIQQPLEIFLTEKGIYLRKIFTTIIIASLFFYATYTAGFASVMTIPRYTDSIKNSDQLDASRIKWGAIHPALLDGFKELAKYKHVVENIVIMTNDEIREKMHAKKFAMLADRVPNGLVVADRVNADDVKYYRIIQDDLYWDHCILLVKRSSVLIPSIRKVFLAMKEGGLVYYWEMQAFFEENYKAQVALRFNTDEASVIKLHWSHVQGAFGVLWIGLGIGAVCFLGELFLSLKHRNEMHLHR